MLAGSGWAAGLNLWSVGLVLGIAGRLDLADAPEVFERWWVMLVLGVLYVFEFFVDKIPLIDSAWDIVSTIIRPVGAALIGLAIAQDGDISGVTAMVTSGGFALTSHGAKASVRALINMSPEPFSNWIASVTEDGAAVGMSSMALANPAAAAVLALIFGGFALLTVVVLWRFLRRIRRRILERFRGGWRITGAPPVSAT
jgi:hypothetical protein